MSEDTPDLSSIEEWFTTGKYMKTFHITPYQYIVLMTSDSEEELRKHLHIQYGVMHVNRKIYHDCLVFSIQRNRYSFNNIDHLQHAPVDLYICSGMEEFNAFVSAHALGVDLSNLW